MSVKQLLAGQDENGSGQNIARTGALVVSGLFKYKKTGTGTCTLTLHDTRTDAEIVSFSVPSNNPAAGSIEVAVPDNYYAKVADESGTFAVDAWMDGDA